MKWDKYEKHGNPFLIRAFFEYSDVIN